MADTVSADGTYKQVAVNFANAAASRTDTVMQAGDAYAAEAAALLSTALGQVLAELGNAMAGGAQTEDPPEYKGALGELSGTAFPDFAGTVPIYGTLTTPPTYAPGTFTPGNSATYNHPQNLFGSQSPTSLVSIPGGYTPNYATTPTIDAKGVKPDDYDGFGSSDAPDDIRFKSTGVVNVGTVTVDDIKVDAFDLSGDLTVGEKGPDGDVTVDGAPGVAKPDIPGFGGVPDLDFNPPTGGISLPGTDLVIEVPQFAVPVTQHVSTGFHTVDVQSFDPEVSISAEVWQAIWSKAIADLKREELAALREANAHHANLGWDMPGVSMFALRAAALNKSREGVNKITAENTIKRAEMLREDYWQSINANMEAEKLNLQAHFEQEKLLLQGHSDYMGQLIQVQVGIANERVALYSAAIERFKATVSALLEVQVKSAEIGLQGELGKVTAFTAQANAAVQAYSAHAQALTAAYTSYNDATTRGYSAEVDGKTKVYAAKNGAIAEMYSAYTRALADAFSAKANAQVGAYKAKTDAQVAGYAAKTDAQIKEFSAQADAEFKSADVLIKYDQNLVEKYKAEWTGVTAKAQAYAAYVEGLRAYASAQQAIVAAFGESVTAEKSKVDANIAQWQAYSAGFEGWRVQAELAKADASVIGAHVQRYQADVQKDIAVTEGNLKVFEAGVEDYKAQSQAWLGQADHAVKTITTQAEIYKADANAHVSVLNGRAEGLKAKAAILQAALQAYAATADIDIREYETNMRGAAAKAEAIGKLGTVAAQVYSQIAASAYSAMNYSISGSGTVSAGASLSNGWSLNIGADASSDYGGGLSPL